MKDKIIALDGPSGAGKSSITKTLARTLGLKYVDSGAIYRTAAYIANNLFTNGTVIQEQLLKQLAQSRVRYQPNDQVLIELNGQDISTKIREHGISAMASKVSAISEVRDWVNSQLRNIVRESDKICIMEGRDIGSVIFPNAILKFYLTASAEVRANRRFDELKQMGKLGTLTKQQILDDINARDLADSTRQIAPLICAKDAIKVDTSELSFEQVLDKISLAVKKVIFP